MPSKKSPEWWKAYRENKKKEKAVKADSEVATESEVLELQQETVARIANATPIATPRNPEVQPLQPLCNPEVQPLQPRHNLLQLRLKKLHIHLQPLLATPLQPLARKSATPCNPEVQPLICLQPRLSATPTAEYSIQPLCNPVLCNPMHSLNIIRNKKCLNQQQRQKQKFSRFGMRKFQPKFRPMI